MVGVTGLRCFGDEAGEGPVLFAAREAGGVADRGDQGGAADVGDTEKNTAIGNHAGPVGSITTSSRVPAGQPANAIVSISLKLSTVGHALRLATVLPSPSSTRTVCALAIPKSMPTRRLSLITFSLGSCRCFTGSPNGATSSRPRSQGRHALTAAPTHVLQPAPTSTDRATSLIRGIRGQPRCGKQLDGARPPFEASPETISAPPPAADAARRFRITWRTEQEQFEALRIPAMADAKSSQLASGI